MNFYEYMGKKLHFMFGNRALTYVSTEGEPAIKQLEAEQNEQVKKKGRKAEPETVTACLLYTSVSRLKVLSDSLRQSVCLAVRMRMAPIQS